MEKKQTAVEWLASQLGTHIIWEETIIDIIEQAKQMEREQLIEAANNGCKGMCMIDTSRDGKNYYNETYGGHFVDANKMIDHISDVSKMVGGQDEEML